MNSDADRVFARLRQGEAEPVGLLGEELVRDLHQDAGAVAGARIGADRAAVLQIAQDGERVLDQLVRVPALDVGDEADAAGILVERRIVETLRDRAWRRLEARRARVRRGAPVRSVAPAASSAIASRAHSRPRLTGAMPQLASRRTRRPTAPGPCRGPRPSAPRCFDPLAACRRALARRVAARLKQFRDAPCTAADRPMPYRRPTRHPAEPPIGTAILSYFTLPNSKREDKGSPMGKCSFSAIVSAPAAQKRGMSLAWQCGRAVTGGEWRIGEWAMASSE